MKKMKQHTAIVLLSLAPLLACKSLKEKVTGGATSTAPAASAVAPAASASAPAPAGGVAGNAVPAPIVSRPLPLAKGQFVLYRVTDDAGQHDFSYSVVDEEGGAHWIQVVTERSGRRVVIQLLLKIGERNTPSTAELLAVRMKMGSSTREFRGALLAQARKSVADVMKELDVPGLDGLKQEDVTVPAGTFKSCYYREATMTLYGFHSRNKSWLHTGVPVLALVKLVSVGKNFTMELKEYGITGAKSEL